MELRLILNRSGNGKYNPISVNLTRIKNIFVCEYRSTTFVTSTIINAINFGYFLQYIHIMI